MIEQLRITVLSENTAGRRDVLAEHGLALWIEADGQKILFDTGQGLVLTHNAEVLGIDLGSVDAVVLSHGHYDHAGGLSAGRDAFRKATVYVHPAAFQARYGVKDGQPRYIGASLGSCADLEKLVAGVVMTREPTRIIDGVWVTGEIPRRHSFEDTGGRFYLDEAGTRPDDLVDDQALYIQMRDGIVVVLGCAHAGLVNTMEYVSRLTKQGRLRAVVGGMHLLHASEDRVSRSIAALRDYNVQAIGPVHCTGFKATAAILSAFPDRFLPLSVGSVHRP